MSRLLLTFCLAVLVVVLAGAPASALTLDDFPEAARPDWFGTIEPDNIAFALYDYTQSQGLLGQHTDLFEGSCSLFDEAQSGISCCEGNWCWNAGEGWVTDGSSITFLIGNLRVPTNRKQLALFAVLEGGLPVLDNISVTTDNPQDVIRTGKGYTVTAGNQVILMVHATITPQPDWVAIRVPFQVQSPMVLSAAGFLDRCVPIPEPATLALLGAGGLVLIRRRR